MPNQLHVRIQRRTRVLCVDDSDDTRAILRAFLEAEGYEVCEAENAHAALRLLGAERFDLLVTDHMMPDQTGTWLLREAQARGLLSNMRAVIVTAHQEAQLLDCPPGIPVFQKPVDLDRFMGALSLLAAEAKPTASVVRCKRRA